MSGRPALKPSARVDDDAVIKPRGSIEIRIGIPVAAVDSAGEALTTVRPEVPAVSSRTICSTTADGHGFSTTLVTTLVLSELHVASPLRSCILILGASIGYPRNQ